MLVGHGTKDAPGSVCSKRHCIRRVLNFFPTITSIMAGEWFEQKICLYISCPLHPRRHAVWARVIGCFIFRPANDVLLQRHFSRGKDARRRRRRRVQIATGVVERTRINNTSSHTVTHSWGFSYRVVVVAAVGRMKSIVIPTPYHPRIRIAQTNPPRLTHALSYTQ